MLFKRVLILSSAGSSVQWNETVFAILEEGIMWNIHVKLFYIWTSGSGDVKRNVYRRQTHDVRRPITIAHLEPSAQVSYKALS